MKKGAGRWSQCKYKDAEDGRGDTDQGVGQPPASAFGMVVNSMDGATAGAAQEIANRYPNGSVANARTLRNGLVMAAGSEPL